MKIPGTVTTLFTFLYASLVLASPGNNLSKTLAFTLEGPWEAITQQRNKETEYDGWIRLGTVQGSPSIPVKISVRGTTSLDPEECPFPKLKLRLVNKNDSQVFGGSRSIKIGTHCGDETEASSAGRIRAGGAGVGPEALAYHLMTVLGIPHQLAQMARISYVDPKNPHFQVMNRPAFFLETEKATAERLNAEEVGFNEGLHTDGMDFDNVITNEVSPKSAAMLYLFEALVGNNDFSLPLNDVVDDPDEMAVGLKNIFVLKPKSEKQLLVVPQDFDLAAAITGSFPPLCVDADCTKNAETENEKIQAFVQSRFARLKTIMTDISPSLKNGFNEAVAEFRAKMPTVLNEIEQAEAAGLISKGQATRFKAFASELMRMTQK